MARGVTPILIIASGGPTAVNSGGGESFRQLWLNLLARSISRMHDAEETDYRAMDLKPSWVAETSHDEARIKDAAELLAGVSSNSDEHRLAIRRAVRMSAERLADGTQIHPNSESMAGLLRLQNIAFCLDAAREESIPGDYVEVGVWRGGSLAMAAAALAGVSEALVYGYDTFDGFEAAPLLGPDEGHGLESEEALRSPVDVVSKTFLKFNVPANAVRLVSGNVTQTSLNHEGSIAVLRLDVDLYVPTMAALTNLFPKVSPGGYVIIDDWDLPIGPKRRRLAQEAVRDYLDDSGTSVEFVEIDKMGIYFRRP